MDVDPLSGVVAAVDSVANPVTLARMLMERTNHCLLAGKGAHQFAVECGAKTIDPSSLIVDRSWENWRDFRRRKKSMPDSLPYKEYYAKELFNLIYF